MANQFEQSLLRYLSPEQLATIQSTRIGIAGAGGLGSNVAVTLVRTGFRQLTILDQDVVEASNLNRQDYLLADVGKPKVKVLKQRLIAINPDVDIITHQSTWAPENAAEFFGQCDILVEAFDKAQIKRDFTEWALTGTKPVISGNGMAGLTGACTSPLLRSAQNGAAPAGLPGARTSPLLRSAQNGAAPADLAIGEVTTVRKIGNLTLVGHGITSIHDGHPPLAPRVIQCAAKMAEIVLQLTLKLS